MQRAAQVLMLLLTGLGIGWLSGLSHSEVASTLIASLVAVVGGAFAGLKSGMHSGKATSSNATLDALPIVILVLGISVGAPFGIMARTHAILGNEVKTTTTRVITGSKVEINEVTERIGGGLYEGPIATACKSLIASSYDDSPAQFRASFSHFSPEFRATEGVVADTELLKKIARQLCETSGVTNEK